MYLGNAMFNSTPNISHMQALILSFQNKFNRLGTGEVLVGNEVMALPYKWPDTTVKNDIFIRACSKNRRASPGPVWDSSLCLLCHSSTQVWGTTIGRILQPVFSWDELEHVQGTILPRGQAGDGPSPWPGPLVYSASPVPYVSVLCSELHVRWIFYESHNGVCILQSVLKHGSIYFLRVKRGAWELEHGTGHNWALCGLNSPLPVLKLFLIFPMAFCI